MHILIKGPLLIFVQCVIGLVMSSAFGSTAYGQDTLHVTVTIDTLTIGHDIIQVRRTDSTYAADSAALGTMVDSALASLDTALIPTSILIDKAMVGTALDAYDGSTINDTARSTLITWIEFERSIPLGRVRASRPMISSDSLDSNVMRAYAQNLIPIGIARYSVSQLKQNVLADSLLVLSADGRHLLEVPGVHDSPYITRTLFLARPLCSFHIGLAVTFITDTAQFSLSNTNDTITGVNVDFGDGNGFQAVAPAGQAVVHYSDTGEKQITVRVVYGTARTDTLESITTMQIFDRDIAGASMDDPPSGNSIPSSPSGFSSTPDEVLPVESNLTYLGEKGYGEASIWYGCNHTALKKPIIFVEGFDPVNSIDAFKFYAKYSGPFGGWDFVHDGLLERLRKNGFDIVFLNFRNGSDYIQRNAFLLESLIETVNARKQSNAKLVVLGESMGGLVTRYALADMEKNRGIDHKVRLFISHDSPQRGAFVPMSMHYLANEVEGAYNRVKSLVTIVGFALSMIIPAPVILYAKSAYLDPLIWQADQFLPSKLAEHKPATIQMSAFYLDENSIPREHPLRTTLINELNNPSTGLGYPNPHHYRNGVRNVAVTCGSLTGSHQSDNDGPTFGNEQLIKIGIAIGKIVANFSANLSSTPVPAEGWRNIARIYHSFLFFGSSINVDVITPRCYECMPGGSHDMLGMIYDNIPQYVTSHPFRNVCFVPCVSALDIETDTWDADLYTGLKSGSITTPFDAVYWSAGNKLHTKLDRPIVDSLLWQELYEEDLYLQNYEVSADEDFQASRRIFAGNNVYPANFRFNPAAPDLGDVTVNAGVASDFIAGTEIVLKPGFQAVTNSKFHAYIDPPMPCSGAGPKTVVRGMEPRPATQHLAAAESMSTAFPNPFASETTVEFTVDEPAPVSLILLDLLGHTIRTVENIEQALPGKYRLTIRADDLPSGTYAYTLRIGDRTELKRLILTR